MSAGTFRDGVRAVVRRGVARLVPTLVAAAWLTSPSAAAEAPARTLEDGRWELISPPADPNGATLAEIFADGVVLLEENYNVDWVVYGTTPPTGPGVGPGYRKLAVTDTLEAGQGYWFIQAAGEDVTVTMPDGSGPPEPEIRRGCPSVAGCAGASLESVDDGREFLWYLTGLPIAEPTPLADTAVLTDDGACASGCTLVESTDAEILFRRFWRYVDADGVAYERLDETSTLDPWDGVWSVLYPNATGRSARWVVGAEVPDERPDLANDYTVAFEDEFDGLGLDASKWNTGHIWGPYVTINDERQLYVDTLRVHPNSAYDPFVFTNEGTMKIVASKLGDGVTVPERPPEGDPLWNFLDYDRNPDYDASRSEYLSGILTSYEAFRFAHGYAEIRAKVPKGPGLWPAFWLLPSQYVEIVPEIDVMEYLGQNAKEVYQTYHFFDRGDPARDWQARRTPTYETVGPDFSADFHTYGVAWEPGQLIWYVDGKEVRRVRDGDPSISGEPIVLPRQAMFLIANLAVGGNWPGPPTAATAFPAEYEIDYVRAWKKDMTTPVDLDEYSLAFGDEFDGTALDAGKWNTAFIWGPHLPINCEEQYYVDALGVDRSAGYSPFEVGGGRLTITAAEAGTLTPSNVPTPTPDPLPEPLATQRADKVAACLASPFWKDRPEEFRPGTKYTSGILTSYEAFKFVEGYAEIRAQVPAGDGLWPAFWLLNGYYVHENPEIDVMEIVGEEPGRVHHAFHRQDWSLPNGVRSRKYSRVGGDGETGYADGFHTYAVQWKRDEIVWYVDGEVSATYAGEDVPEQLMYVIVNLAVGGNFNTRNVDAAALPAELVVDYIRVYQHADTP